MAFIFVSSLSLHLRRRHVFLLLHFISFNLSFTFAVRGINMHAADNADTILLIVPKRLGDAIKIMETTMPHIPSKTVPNATNDDENGKNKRKAKRKTLRGRKRKNKYIINLPTSQPTSTTSERQHEQKITRSCFYHFHLSGKIDKNKHVRYGGPSHSVWMIENGLRIETLRMKTHYSTNLFVLTAFSFSTIQYLVMRRRC